VSIDEAMHDGVACISQPASNSSPTLRQLCINRRAAALRSAVQAAGAGGQGAAPQCSGSCPPRPPCHHSYLHQ